MANPVGIKEQIALKIKAHNDCRTELDAIKAMFKPHKKKRGLGIFIIGTLILCLPLLVLSIMDVMEDVTIDKTVTEQAITYNPTKIINNTQIINNTNIINPEIIANCVKIEELVNGTLTGRYSLKCEAIDEKI